jgi:hypothetical protein
VEVDRTGRSFGFNYSINGVADEFHTDAGFVNRTGYINAHLFNRVSFFGAQGALLEQVRVYFRPSRLWNYDDFGGDAIEGADGGTVELTLRGGWAIEVEGERNFFRPDAGEYADLEVAAAGGAIPFVPAAIIRGKNINLSVETPTYRHFTAGVGVGIGEGAIFEEAAEGTGLEIEAEVALRPTSQIRITASTVYAQITRNRDDSEFARSVIPRLKAEYQATRHLFLRGIAEYHAERQAALVDPRTGNPVLRGGAPVLGDEDNGIRFDALISYEPTPGTVAYIGYGSSYAELTPLRSGFTRQNDGFFVKLAYQFRR